MKKRVLVLRLVQGMVLGMLAIGLIGCSEESLNIQNESMERYIPIPDIDIDGEDEGGEVFNNVIIYNNRSLDSSGGEIVVNLQIWFRVGQATWKEDGDNVPRVSRPGSFEIVTESVNGSEGLMNLFITGPNGVALIDEQVKYYSPNIETGSANYKLVLGDGRKFTSSEYY